MVPDPRWIDALKLPAKIFAGLFLFSVLVLGFNYLQIISLAEIHALARPIAIIAALLFGSLSVAAVGGVIYELIMQRHKRTLLSARREIRRDEAKQRQAEHEAFVLKRLAYLSKEEVRYVADCLRKCERSFTAYAHSPAVSNLQAAGLVGTPGGPHNQDYYPYYFFDFAWEEILARRNDFIAIDDDNKKQEAAEKERTRKQRGY